MTYNHPRSEIVAVRQREGEDESNTPSEQYLKPWTRNCGNLYLYRYTRFLYEFLSAHDKSRAGYWVKENQKPHKRSVGDFTDGELADGREDTISESSLPPPPPPHSIPSIPLCLFFSPSSQRSKEAKKKIRTPDLRLP